MALHCHDDNKVLKKVVKLMKKNMDEGEKKLSKEAAGSVGGHAIAVFRTRGESNGKVVTRKLKFVLIHSFRRNKMADVGENRANSSSLHRGWREQLAQSLHIALKNQMLQYFENFDIPSRWNFFLRVPAPWIGIRRG